VWTSGLIVAEAIVNEISIGAFADVDFSREGVGLFF